MRNTIWDDLLVADHLARNEGQGGLHPRLRAAIEAAGRFPTYSSGPGGAQAAATLPQALDFARITPQQGWARA